MTSILTETQAMTRSNGTFVVVVAGNISSAFSNTLAVAASGYINSAGSLYNYQTTANASSAITASMTTGTAVVVGDLLQDKGNRIVFSAEGQTVAIFAEVLLLNNLSTEGGETTYYACIWTGNPTAEHVVRVARI
jgi:hypothetical protein